MKPRMFGVLFCGACNKQNVNMTVGTGRAQPHEKWHHLRSRCINRSLNTTEPLRRSLGRELLANLRVSF